MRKYRRQKMESLILEHLSFLILKEFEFPALVTITNIKIDDEFKNAKAIIKILPKDFKNAKKFKNQEIKILKELNDNQNKIFKILLKKLNIKPLPKIIFQLSKD
ncbi:MAG: ribosome-binding factor A [Patescibacteria group bacterium]|nr:ribosome-binding factor A [Patescibacteria group bacterium]